MGLVTYFGLICLITFARAQSDDDLLVTIKNGQVLGYRNYTDAEQLPYKAFKGIPYAEPPVGPLRFEVPVSKSSWDGILDATEQPEACLQESSISSSTEMGSEDCLYLNVIVPEINNNNGLLPVMVWLPGGAFITGDTRDRPDYLIEKGVLWVGVQSRLGIFGFSSTGDMASPGNVGLKDILLALKWIQENIQSFGGDPNEVTIFGQSSGAMSVSYLVQSPLAKGLFKGAIMDSGSTLAPSAIQNPTIQSTISTAKNLNIDTTNTTQMIEDLKQVNASDLLSAAQNVFMSGFLSNGKDGLAFGPVSEPEHEGALFSGYSYEQLLVGNFSKVPILLGYNTQEGAVSFGIATRLFMLPYSVPQKLVPKDMNINNAILNGIAGVRINQEYFQGSSPAADSNGTINYISDDEFIRGSIKYAKLATEFTPVYLYEFEYKGILGDPNNTATGTYHTEELNYLFARDYNGTESDNVMRQIMTTLWTNFVKYGNPTPEQDALLQNIIWPEVGTDSNYLRINKTLSVDTNPKGTFMSFWDNLYNALGNRPFGTY